MLPPPLISSCQSLSKEPGRDAHNSGLRGRTWQVPGERGRQPQPGSSSPFLVQATGGRVKGGHAGSRHEGGSEGGWDGAALGYRGDQGPPAGTRGGLRAGRSGGSKARAENLPEQWPSLPHPVHSVPAASSVSSVKLGLLEGPSHPVLLHSGPVGWVASSPAFGFPPFLPHLLHGASGVADTPGTTGCIACLSPPPETSRDVRGNPSRTPRSKPRGLQVYNLMLWPVFGHSWW